MKPDNWRTDYDWTDPDDYPVQDDKMFDIQSEEELMLPHEIKAPPKGIESLQEGQRFATVDPIEKKILELMARGLSRELAEVIVKSGMSEDSYEIMDKAEGGRIGYAGGSGEDIVEEIYMKFSKKFPNWDTDQIDFKDMVAMLQLEGTMGTKGAGILDKYEGTRMITPQSVAASARAIDRHRGPAPEYPHGFDHPIDERAQGGSIGYAYGDDDPEIVEDDLTTLEFMQDQGVPYGEQASGIDKDVLIEKVVEEFIKRKGRKPRSIEEIKTFYMQEMAGGSGEPQRVAYNPGDYDPMIVEEYEKYKFGQEEQGAPVITIDEFLIQSRSGAQAGGLPGILGI